MARQQVDFADPAAIESRNDSVCDVVHKNIGEPAWTAQQRRHFAPGEISNESARRPGIARSIHEGWTYDDERSCFALRLTRQPMRVRLGAVILGMVWTLVSL